MRSRITDSNGAPSRWWRGGIEPPAMEPICDGRSDPTRPVWTLKPELGNFDGYTVTASVVVDRWAWRNLGSGPELVGEVSLAPRVGP